MEADRYNEGKPKLSYILTFGQALREVAKVCMYGENKYDRGNYLKGAPLSQYVDCALRHLDAYWNGEDIDPESGCTHLGHFLWNCLCLVEMALTQPQRDDRINQKNVKDKELERAIKEVENMRKDRKEVMELVPKKEFKQVRPGEGQAVTKEEWDELVKKDTSSGPQVYITPGGFLKKKEEMPF